MMRFCNVLFAFNINFTNKNSNAIMHIEFISTIINSR